MSVNEIDEDEPRDNNLWWCSLHEVRYVRFCQHCRDEAADRRHDDKDDRKYTFTPFYGPYYLL